MCRLLLLALLVSFASGCGFGGRTTAPSPRETLASQVVRNVPRWIKQEHLPRKAHRGARVFATAGCTACHTYAGSGGSNLGAPDLTAIGRHQLGVRFQIDHLKCPSCVNQDSPMPPFASLGRKRLHELAIFLEASKGIR